MSFNSLMKIISLAALASGAFAAPKIAKIVPRQHSATACCPDMDSFCQTATGTTPNGLGFCYGYTSGTQYLTQDDVNTAKCLTNLHYTQDTQCITPGGASCASGSEISKAATGVLVGSSQFSTDDSDAIQEAIQAMFNEHQGFTVDTDDYSNGYITFAHMADNGSGIKALDVYFFTDGC